MREALQHYLSQVNATCVPLCKKLPCHMLCNLHPSRPIFFPSLVAAKVSFFPIPFAHGDGMSCVFPIPFAHGSGLSCVFPVPFVQGCPVFLQFHLPPVVDCPVFFQFHLSVPVPFQFLVCMPHTPVGTVSPSDVSTSFGIQISTVETSVCMLLILFQTAHNSTFHGSMQPVCLLHGMSHSFFSLMRNLPQNARSITFSQVNATCVPLCKTLPCHMLCNLRPSRPIFFPSLAAAKVSYFSSSICAR